MLNLLRHFWRSWFRILVEQVYLFDACQVPPSVYQAHSVRSAQSILLFFSL
jgi:hypothetical protein